jgi:hypothetical protein
MLFAYEDYPENAHKDQKPENKNRQIPPPHFKHTPPKEWNEERDHISNDLVCLRKSRTRYSGPYFRFYARIK